MRGTSNRNLIKTITLVMALVSSLAVARSSFGETHPMVKRVAMTKKATVKVVVNGVQAGSGFIIAPGVVATCFHVIQQITETSDGMRQIGSAPSVKVEFFDGVKGDAVLHQACTGAAILECVTRDFALLRVDRLDLEPLVVGAFGTAEEGAEIYTIGYPFHVDQPVVARGVLSTKWEAPGYLNRERKRDVAWLDLTMNKGNSGGPVIAIGETLGDDRVIGIATFILNPFAGPSEKIVQNAQRFPGEVTIASVGTKEFASLVGTALAANSLGVGGCVSIDYAQRLLAMSGKE